MVLCYQGISFPGTSILGILLLRTLFLRHFDFLQSLHGEDERSGIKNIHFIKEAHNE